MVPWARMKYTARYISTDTSKVRKKRCTSRDSRLVLSLPLGYSILALLGANQAAISAMAFRFDFLDKMARPKRAGMGLD